MSLQAVVLAAGEGSRLGGPKALARWHPRGLPWALAHALALRRRGAREVLLVLREDVALTLGPLPTGVRAVLSHAPDAWGPAGSLQAATWSLSMEGLVCVTPVDALPVGSRVYRALREAVGAQDVLAAVPTFEGRGGHPVLMHAQVLRPYRACSVPRSLREMLSSLGDRVQRVPVPDPRVRADLDTPEAVDLWRHRRSFVYNHD